MHNLLHRFFIALLVSISSAVFYVNYAMEGPAKRSPLPSSSRTLDVPLTQSVLTLTELCILRLFLRASIEEIHLICPLLLQKDMDSLIAWALIKRFNLLPYEPKHTKNNLTPEIVTAIIALFECYESGSIQLKQKKKTYTLQTHQYFYDFSNPTDIYFQTLKDKSYSFSTYTELCNLYQQGFLETFENALLRLNVESRLFRFYALLLILQGNIPHYFTYSIEGTRCFFSNIPRAIQYFTQLKKLWLPENRLRSIPNVISNCINLQILQLSRNRIRIFPDSISNCTNLTYLDLSNNEIQEIPENINTLTKLESIYLNKNEIEIIPSLSNLSNLHTLHLQGNYITSIDPSISSLPQLTDFKK